MSYIVSSGQVSNGIVLDDDDMTVLGGGTAVETTVNDGGNLYVSGGTATETTVNHGGAALPQRQAGLPGNVQKNKP